MTDSESVSILYIPCGTAEEAAEISTVLISERLIACANVYTSRSIYRWQGKVEDEAEYVVFAKTIASRAEAAAKRAEQLHSYQIPCVITIRPESVNDAYRHWLVGEVEVQDATVATATGSGG